MNKRSIFVGVMLALGAVSASAQCYAINYAAFGSSLKEDMTETEVVQLTASQATAVSQGTCGQQSDTGAWTCKTEIWGALCSGELMVYFRKNADGVWVVNNWEAIAPVGF